MWVCNVIRKIRNVGNLRSVGMGEMGGGRWGEMLRKSNVMHINANNKKCYAYIMNIQNV